MSNQPQTLVVQNGPQAGQSFTLTGGFLTIGRTPGNQIVIADGTISRQHARLTVQPDGVFIEDLGSSNGTFVNGQRVINRVALTPGDTVKVGTSITLGVQGVGGVVPAPVQAVSGSAGRGLTMGLAALVVIIVIGVATWFVVQSQQPSETDSAAPATEEPTATPVPTPTPVPQVVLDFTVDKTTVQLGECVTLRWRVEEAKEVRLDGESVPPEGNRKVCPQEATNTYRLTALSLDGETEEQALSLTVPPTPPPPPDLNIEFVAAQTTVSFGECTELRWSVENALEVRLAGDKVGATGAERVCPEDPQTSYKLVVQPLEGPGVEQVVTIDVPATPMPTATPVPTDTPRPQAQQPYVDKFIADQTALNQGSCTSLRWSVRNAQSVQLSGGEIGSQTVGREGARRVCPPTNGTTYSLVAAGSDGSDQRSLTMAVTVPTVIVQPQPVAPPSGPASVNVCARPAEGICYNFRWDIENVREIYFDGEGVGGHDSRKVCDAEALPGERGRLRIIHTDGHVEEIVAWPPC